MWLECVTSTSTFSGEYSVVHSGRSFPLSHALVLLENAISCHHSVGAYHAYSLLSANFKQEKASKGKLFLESMQCINMKRKPKRVNTSQMSTACEEKLCSTQYPRTFPITRNVALFPGENVYFGTTSVRNVVKRTACACLFTKLTSLQSLFV